MAFNFKVFWQGLRIKPKTTSTADSKGDLEVIDSSNKLQFHNGTTVSPVVTEAHTATLTNKSLTDSNVTFVDASDATKQVKIDAGGTTGTSTTISAAQTANRTLTLPDATDTLVGKATTDTFTNKTIDANATGNSISNLETTDLAAGVLNTSTTMIGASNTQIPSALAIKTYVDNVAAAQNEASEISFAPVGTIAATTVQAMGAELDGDIQTHISSTVAHGATGAVVGTTNTQTLINKTLDNSSVITVRDANLTIQDDIDVTKQVKIQASGVATATTRTLSVPNADGTIVLDNNTQTLSNKTLDNTSVVTVKDTNFTIQDDIDVTKQVKIQASGLATATTRTLSVPNADGTLVLDNNIQTITNKTVVAASNAITTAASGNLTATELNAALAELQGDIDTRATSAALTSHTGASTGVHGVTGAVVGTTDAQTLSSKSLVDVSTSIVDSVDATKKIIFDAAGTTATTTTLLSSQTVNRTLTLPDATDTLATVTQVNAKVTGPASATDNAIPRYDATTGKLIKNSGVLVSDTNVMTGLTGITSSGTVLSTGTLVANAKFVESVTEDSSATGSNASIVASTAPIIRLTNASLISLGTITGQETGLNLAVINRTGAAITVLNNSGAGATSILTGTNANLTLANEASIQLKYDSVASRWMIIGGSGSGSTSTGTTDSDVLMTQSFESALLSDFTQSGLSLATSNPIDGTISALLTHQAGSSQYFTQAGISVPRKFRGTNMTGYVVLRSTATSGNVTLTVTDTTNSATLQTVSLQTDSQSISSLTRTNASPTISGFTNSAINLLSVGMSVTGTGIPAGTVINSISTSALTITLSQNATSTSAGAATISVSALPKTLQFGFNIPTNCATISYTVTALQESGSPETYVDDIKIANYWYGVSNEGQSNIIVPTIDVQSQHISAASAAVGTITGSTTSTSGSGVFSYNSGTGIYTALKAGEYSISASWESSAAAYSYIQVFVNGVKKIKQVAGNVTTLEANAAGTVRLAIGDTFYYSVANSAANNVILYVSATAVATSTVTSTDLVPAKSVLGSSTFDVPVVTDWVAYTPTFTGFGTPTSVEAQWRRNGANHEYRVKFVPGTPTAVEARVSLANGSTSATTSVIPSIQNAGSAIIGVATASRVREAVVLIEPSVTYVTFAFGDYDAASSPFTKQNGNALLNSGETVSFFASVPIAGLSANEEITVSGTQQLLTQEADSYLKINTGNGFGSTGTRIRRFTTVVANQGSDILYQDSATAGSSFTVQESGVYSINYTDIFTANGLFGLSKNASSLTTNISSLAAAEVLTTSTAAANLSNQVSWTGYLTAGDIVRPHTDTLTENASTGLVRFIMTKQGSTKVLNTTSDQKIEIPTSELRFEGASSRGATATAIVKFDTLAKIRGDAFTVTNTTNDGTYITMTKAGKLSVSASLYYSVAGLQYSITKNQTTLTSAAAPVGERLLTVYINATTVAPASWTGDVVVGDIIRIASNVTPTADPSNLVEFSFQEQKIAVSVSNTLPQFSESDSSIRLDTANGYGSTATKIRRFSNVRDNIGTDIVYADSATLGSTFTVQTSGTYSISYSDALNGAGAAIGLSKNASSLSVSVATLASSEVLSLSVSAAAGGFYDTASWTGFLNAGDIIRPHTDGTAAATNTYVSFTISKVGKPNVTGVNVTPFINVPQPTTQVYRLSQAANATTDYVGEIRFNLATASITNGGDSTIITVSDDATGARTKFTANKKCSVNISARGPIYTNGWLIELYKNGSVYVRGADVTTSTYASVVNGQMELAAGEFFTIVYNGGGTIGAAEMTVTFEAEALSDQILTAPETFSTDTNPLTYASSSSYTLSTLANAPVGTFITGTYTINSNTFTQSTTAPTQTTADMNTNGILIYGRPYNAESTAAQPAYVAIQIGKGMKGVQLGLYKSSGKTTAGNLDYVVASTLTEYGAFSQDYNELTGILVVNVAQTSSSGNTSKLFRFSDISTQANGYLVINASKNPALAGLGLNRIGANYTSNSGQAISTQAVITYEDVVTDTNNAYNTSTGAYTVPENGWYQVNASFGTAAVTLTTGQAVQLDLFKNGSSVATARTIGNGAGQVYDVQLSNVLYLSQNDTIDLRSYASVATTMQTTSTYNTFSIVKVSI